MILLDTHVLIWNSNNDRRLGRSARRTIQTALADGNAAISSISFWEIAMRTQKGQLELGSSMDAWRTAVLEDGLLEIPVDSLIGMRAGLLADLHGDPADRIIVATATEGHQLITADQRILRWPGSLSRLDARE